MTIRTKTQFVADVIRENPGSKRETIINKIARHRIDYRGKKFTKQTAARYYWHVMKTQFATRKVIRTRKATIDPNKLSITVPTWMNRSQRIDYVIKVLTSSGILN